MTNKSHVGMGFSVCPICMKEHDEVVLLDTRLRESLTDHMFMGWDLCPEHKEMEQEYIAFVECEGGGDTITKIKLHEAKRTGRIAHVRREVANNMLRANLPANLPFVFVDKGVIDLLEKMTQHGSDVTDVEAKQ